MSELSLNNGGGGGAKSDTLVTQKSKDNDGETITDHILDTLGLRSTLPRELIVLIDNFNAFMSEDSGSPNSDLLRTIFEHNLKSASYYRQKGAKTMTLKDISEELDQLKKGRLKSGIEVYIAISNLNIIKCILDVNNRFKELEEKFPDLEEPDVQNIYSESNTEGFWNTLANKTLQIAQQAADLAKDTLERNTGIIEFVKNMKKMPILFKTREGVIASFDILKSLTPLLTTYINEDTFNQLSKEVENARHDKKKPTISYEYFSEKFMDPAVPSHEYEAGNKLNVIVDRFADFIDKLIDVLGYSLVSFKMAHCIINIMWISKGTNVNMFGITDIIKRLKLANISLDGLKNVINQNKLDEYLGVNKENIAINLEKIVSGVILGIKPELFSKYGAGIISVFVLPQVIHELFSLVKTGKYMKELVNSFQELNKSISNLQIEKDSVDETASVTDNRNNTDTRNKTVNVTREETVLNSWGVNIITNLISPLIKARSISLFTKMLESIRVEFTSLLITIIMLMLTRMPIPVVSENIGNARILISVVQFIGNILSLISSFSGENNSKKKEITTKSNYSGVTKFLEDPIKFVVRKIYLIHKERNKSAYNKEIEDYTKYMLIGLFDYMLTDNPPYTIMQISAVTLNFVFPKYLQFIGLSTIVFSIGTLMSSLPGPVGIGLSVAVSVIVGIIMYNKYMKSHDMSASNFQKGGGDITSNSDTTLVAGGLLQIKKISKTEKGVIVYFQGDESIEITKNKMGDIVFSDTSGNKTVVTRPSETELTESLQMPTDEFGSLIHNTLNSLDENMRRNVIDILRGIGVTGLNIKPEPGSHEGQVIKEVMKGGGSLNTIYDANTKQFVNLFSNIGLRVLKNYIKMYNKHMQ
jgi:hypothetical protein